MTWLYSEQAGMGLMTSDYGRYPYPGYKGNFEEMNDPGAQVPREDWMPYTTHDGRPVNRGNKPDVLPGPEDTYQSIGIPWGNCANTPFRLYKHYAHEGGISTPFLARWPKGIKQANTLTH